MYKSNLIGGAFNDETKEKIGLNDNKIYYTAEEWDNGYNCSQPLDYKTIFSAETLLSLLR